MTTPAAHGTIAAAARHRRAGEPLCGPCRDAQRAYDRDRYRGLVTRRPDPQPCGTEAAHKRHVRRGETPCEDCRVAVNAANQSRIRVNELHSAMFRGAA